MTPSNTRRFGFTLIELLIVVAILGLLIGILLPAFAKARQTAKKTQCANRLRGVFAATMMYVGDEGKLPPLNDDPNDGSYQFNYLIFDGKDFDRNFGPLARPNGIIKFTEQLFCPVQQNKRHMFATELNPWPPRPNMNTRAGYARRYHLSGKSLSQFKRVMCYAADLIHQPEIVLSAHKNGVNAVYTDGHAQWVHDPGLLTNNNLIKPFDPSQNLLMKSLWKMLDRAGR